MIDLSGDPLPDEGSMRLLVCALFLVASSARADFVIDNTSLPASKTNLHPVPQSADTTRYIQASDYNALMNAELDLRSAVTVGQYLGLSAVAGAPTPAVATNFLWFKSSDHTLHFKWGSTDNTVSFGGGFPLFATDGSSGAPSYSFTNQHGMGMWRNASNDLRLTPDGSNAIIISPGGGGVANLEANNLTADGTLTSAGALVADHINTSLGHLVISSTAPTISSGFGSSPSIATNNGSAAFEINVGTGGAASSGVIGLPASTSNWVCFCEDRTTISTTVFRCRQTAGTTTTATIGNFNTSAAAAAWAASDHVFVVCHGD
jgi:hypothetical protein